MNERGPEISVSSLEARYTIGNVEKSVEQRIETTTNKINNDRILEKDAFATEADRNSKANEVIESLGFSSYFDMIDAMNDRNRPAIQNKAKEAFDILAKSVSLAMNFGGNQNFQTALNLGEEFVAEVEPYSWQYINKGNPETVLAQRVREKTITNEKLLEKVRRLDKLRKRINLSDKNEVEGMTRIMENSVLEILEMNVPSKDEMELFTVKAYISTEIAVLRKMYTSKDGSVDKGDEKVINKKERKKVGDDEDEDEVKVDERTIRENRSGGGKEYRSPYEVTPESFVDSLFNYEPPRLYFTPPPEWVRKLSPEQQYLLKIQQKLAVGAATKLGVKDIDAAKARQNEVYNLPTMELKLLYEMPHMKEAMETFVKDLFEFYEEDGRKFLRMKLQKNQDGSLKKNENGGYILDPSVAKKTGDIGTDNSFENYREEMFLKMALRKLYPDKIADINGDNWKVFYKKTIGDYINISREDVRNKKKTDAELEYEWRVQNALEEKRAVATAWNLLFVGNIVESADIYRNLKPTQINSDKIRTMMMPLEKFLYKLSIRKGKIAGDEELFGGNLTLWAKRRFEEQGSEFANKLIYAADHDRTQMTNEQAQWRLFPKRVMCSFNDMYLVDVENKRTGIKDKMTLSEALMAGEKIIFKDDDADVFVSLRDTWDEIISVTPFLIGKAEYSPIQQPDKFTSTVEKMKGLVTGIERIKLTDEEARKKKEKLDRERKEYKSWEPNFGYEKFVDNPETYAWMIANAVGLEINLDVPILNRSALKADRDTYNDYVNNLVRLLDLRPEQSSEIKRILNARSWLSARSAIADAERRSAARESALKSREKR